MGWCRKAQEAPHALPNVCNGCCGPVLCHATQARYPDGIGPPSIGRAVWSHHGSERQHPYMPPRSEPQPLTLRRASTPLDERSLRPADAEFPRQGPWRPAVIRWVRWRATRRSGWRAAWIEDGVRASARVSVQAVQPKPLHRAVSWPSPLRSSWLRAVGMEAMGAYWKPAVHHELGNEWG